LPGNLASHFFFIISGLTVGARRKGSGMRSVESGYSGTAKLSAKCPIRKKLAMHRSFFSPAFHLTRETIEGIGVIHLLKTIFVDRHARVC
jgi:hypothetical protein